MTIDEPAVSAESEDPVGTARAVLPTVPPRAEPVSTPEGDDEADDPREIPARHAGPNWWHRDHPIFTSLMAYFVGAVLVIVVPSTFGFVLSKMFDEDRAADLFPYVALVLAVPLVLLPFHRTRRFGRYLLLGMLLTAVVVLGIAALTLWVLISNDK